MQIKEIKINQLKIGTSIELEQEKHSAILLELNNHSKVFDDTLQGFREQKGAIKVDNQNVDQNSKLNDNVRNIYNRKLLSLKTMLANQQQRHSDLVTADTKRKQMLMIRKVSKNNHRLYHFYRFLLYRCDCGLFEILYRIKMQHESLDYASNCKLKRQNVQQPIQK